MTRRRHTPEQVVRKLREAHRLLNEGEDVASVCRSCMLLAPRVLAPEERRLLAGWRPGDEWRSIARALRGR
jgi:hypothetical protein